MMDKKDFFSSLFPAMVTASVVPLAVFAALAFLFTKDFSLELSARNLLETSKMTAFAVSTGLRDGKPLQETLRASVKGSGIRVTVMGSDGIVIADTEADPAAMENHLYREEIRLALETGYGTDIRKSFSTGVEYAYAAVAVPSPTGTGRIIVRTALAVPYIDERFGSFAFPLALALLSLLVLSITSTAWFTVRMERPVTALENAAKHWAIGDFRATATVREPRELSNLASIMNGMAHELEEKIRITERSRDETMTIFRSMTEAVAVTDASGLVIASNPAFDALFPDKRGDSPITVLGRTWNTAMAEAETRAREGIPVKDDIILYGSNPSRHSVAATPLEGGKGAVIVLNDVTKLLKLETVRKDFTANVSHELKTPIQSIKGFAETLLSGAMDDGEKARKFLNIILKHAGRMEALVDDLLSLARLEETDDARDLTFATLSVGTVVEKAVDATSAAAASKDIVMETGIPEDMNVRGSEGLLVQAVANLLDNAIKYSPGGSRISVSVRAEGQTCAIDVVDSGIGISPKDLGRVFERFYRADKSRARLESAGSGGTGLGLAIVKHIAEVHDGSVSAESAVGKGSVFTLRLPVA